LLGAAIAILLVWSSAWADQPRRSQKEGTKAPAAEKSEAPIDLLSEIDMQDVAEAAVKMKTTIQEAPSIVSILTSKQIKQMGFRDLDEALQVVPNFFDTQYLMGLEENLIGVRGLLDVGPLVMQEGMDLLNPVDHFHCVNQLGIPLHTIRRIEATSGPGSVMWGSNAFTGVINLVSKTADDLDGVEARVGYGGGPGRENWYRAYAMAGQKLFKDRLKVFLHASYDSWGGFVTTIGNGPLLAPATGMPLGDMPMAPARENEPGRSWQTIFSGNAQAGPFRLDWHLPWNKKTLSIHMFGYPYRVHLGEDGLDCTDPSNKGACGSRADATGAARPDSSWISAEYRHVQLSYNDRLWKSRLGVSVRGYFIDFDMTYSLLNIAGSSMVPGGVGWISDFKSRRVGLTGDATMTLPAQTKLLVGGEMVYDYSPDANSYFWGDRTKFPWYCAPDKEGKVCPFLARVATDRITGGLFVNAQNHYLESLIFDAGARLQLYGSTFEDGQEMDPVLLGSGAVVWAFLPNWRLKANYGMGFRPQTFQQTHATREGFGHIGTPGLKLERSYAVQGEVNATLLRDYKAIHQLFMRADYSYTWVYNLIFEEEGTHNNNPEIGIHSVEFFGRMITKKGHWLALSYTFVDVADGMKGKLRNAPNQWVSIQAALNLWRRHFFLTSNLTIYGSAEETSKWGELDGGHMYLGDVDSSGMPVAVPYKVARASDNVLDRIPPAAVWNAGLRFLVPRLPVKLTLDVYNLLDSNRLLPNRALVFRSTDTAGILIQPRVSFFAGVEYAPGSGT